MSKSNKKLERGLRSCVNLLVSIVSLILWGREFQAAGPALTEASFTKPRLNTKYDVVSSIVRPQTGSMAGFQDWLQQQDLIQATVCLPLCVAQVLVCMQLMSTHSLMVIHHLIPQLTDAEIWYSLFTIRRNDSGVFKQNEYTLLMMSTWVKHLLRTYTA